ncbi:MAG: ATP-binding protein [Nostoc sp. DedVER02]|uniref:ATP-binding protein n=1 Tax=unclassified Nostoc TaxID=2593658 RepID=UPI002AD4DA80|nr:MULTISPECIES: ATP-binding protein [unclassified Nostoc]MDZ7990415.1 ATP-binding protein [Nostoc sp. DedVER02]MDZ8115893.1 ATP-binding protein [Nostoc sp. DedVER01b]
MNATTNRNWDEANYRYLSAALAVVRGILENHTAKEQNQSVEKDQEHLQQVLQEAAAAMPAPSALERLCKIFSLSSFESNLLLLCAGMELNGDFAKLCAMTHGDLQRAYPTLSLALAAFPNVHWDAIAPNSPLRYWRLIQLGDGHSLTLSPVRIDERILHYLTGIQYLDERLAGIIEPLPEVSDLVPSHQDLAERIAAVWSQAYKLNSLPIVQLCGNENTSKRAIAAKICQFQGLSLWVMPAQMIPLAPGELDNLIRLWTRETILSQCALLIDCNELDTNDIARLNAIARFIERTKGFLIVTSRERIGLGQRLVVNFDVHQPTSKEQGTVWQDALGSIAPQMNGQVKTLVDQFNLSAATIRAACAEAAGQLAQTPENDITSILWDACRVQARPRLDELAQRIEPSGDWEDLVLPEAQKQILRDIAAHVRQRSTVYNNWGFGGKSARGLGISALFAGASGTGKTLGAEVLAQKLRLDLYRIDLSSVVSKYIGETEKNLRRVFDAAEQGGVILLFDEADALFGKRSEVKDARDRYANIEVSYLLQRMESYPGLAVLTTNLKSAIDTAFLRRIRFVVQFPFPDTTQRAEIWRRVFPADTPTADLDALQLARLNVAGGNIRNIALNAAFLAADAGEAVQMKHVLRAAQTEYSKLEKPLTDAEVGGWM